jgi:hypothetical protein
MIYRHPNELRIIRDKGRWRVKDRISHRAVFATRQQAELYLDAMYAIEHAWEILTSRMPVTCGVQQR